MREKILFVNVTKQCNVNCPRCYLSEESRSKKSLIPFEYIDKALSDPFFLDAETATLTWEGGELSLVGEKTLRSYMEKVKSKYPHIQQTMITNALNMPDWLIDISKEYMNSHFEVTYALGHKYTLDGSSEKYQEKFKKSLKKAVDNNIVVSVNIELNKETYETGTTELVKTMEETGVKIWEFDKSVSFDEFLKNPIYNHLDYPILNGNLTYQQFSEFIIELVQNHGQKLQELKIQSSILWQTKRIQKTQCFAVKNENQMFTLNPDGNILTNVIWTDMKEMYLGNIKDINISDVLNHRIRRNHIRWELTQRGNNCINCEYIHSCEGGTSFIPLFDGQSKECNGGKMIYDFMKNYEGPYNPQEHMFDPKE